MSRRRYGFLYAVAGWLPCFAIISALLASTFSADSALKYSILTMVSILVSAGMKAWIAPKLQDSEGAPVAGDSK